MGSNTIIAIDNYTSRGDLKILIRDLKVDTSENTTELRYWANGWQ